jgi:uncharacterized membrane protein YhaH (DUF805 family)
MSLGSIAFGAGRISRRIFWLWHTGLLALGLAASLGITVAFGWSVSALLPRALFVLVWVGLDWLWMSQTVRRLHDFGRGAAWAAAPQLLWFGLVASSLILPLMAGPLAQPWARPALAGAALVTSLGLAALIWVGLSRGDHKTNRFGPPTWIAHPDPPGMHPDDELLPKGEAAPK